MKYDYKSDVLKEALAYAVFSQDVSYRSAPSLFHYTKKSTRDKIVQDDYVLLRLTRADMFEDNLEGKHIVTAFIDACGYACESHIIGMDFKNYLLNFSNEIEPELEIIRKRNVFCFSKDKDSSYLKENYAGSEGYKIGFQSYILEGMCLDPKYAKDKERPWAELINVIYDTNELKQYLVDQIRKIYRLRQQPHHTLVYASLLRLFILYMHLPINHPIMCKKKKRD